MGNGLDEGDVFDVEKLRSEMMSQIRGLTRIIGQAETQRQGEIRELTEFFQGELNDVREQLFELETKSNIVPHPLELLVIDYDRTTKLLRYSRNGGNDWVTIEEAAES